MANFEIPENPGYDNQIRKVEITDLAHADLLNGMCGRIVENCEHLKKQGDGLREDFDNLLDEETIQLAQETGFLSGGGSDIT